MIYFASDVHLGLNFENQKEHVIEDKFVNWLCYIQNDCEELFLVGDIFDFWFEWNYVVPKGFTRVLGQLAKMADKGIKINFFVGNHDKWAASYFEKELNAKVYFKPQLFDRHGIKILVAHGDGLGKNDTAGRLLSYLFNSKTARWIFQRVLHPDIAMRFGKWWSSGNRHKRGNVSHTFRGENEPIIGWAKNESQKLKPNLIVVGHLHTPTIFELEKCKVAILGEWIVKPAFGKLDNSKFQLVKYEQ